ncbi:nitroreductase [Oceanidesulfovibrio indonesiensis]|jgi:nitroreductase|uniref:Nitroreductase n=1 Tax=Oceanidesulfovibrio indonesiensis TaxID=54767 RepID=A0A7M3MCZ9_9BACT|nr:nitroreductase family protein [Oceanidesulfovibrio indonesiensis]TVM15978.1 nitroreductase [Oceanidesulfovibrio indonesiensis]
MSTPIDFHSLVAKARTVRRYRESSPVSMETLEALVDTARLTPSGGNLQPLRYVLSNDPVTNARIFDCLGWAAYLKDWPGPAEGERPAAYAVILGDSDIAKSIDCDHGIAALALQLGAAEKGLGACILGNVQRKKLATILELPENLSILLVVALGEPAEDVRTEPLAADGSIKYYRDGEGLHRVPKRALDDIILARYQAKG